MKSLVVFTLLMVILLLPTTSLPQQPEMPDLIQTQNFAYQLGTGYIPIEPRLTSVKVKIKRDDKYTEVPVDQLSNDELRAFLPNIYEQFAIAKSDRDGRLTFLTASATRGTGTYFAIWDYSSYFVTKIYDDIGIYIGDGKVGYGLRLMVQMQTTRRGIDLGSIFKVGVAFSRQEVSGRIALQTIGINSRDINLIAPGISGSIDETSLQKALEDLAKVRSKIYDPATNVKAQILAILPKKVESGIKEAQPNFSAFTPPKM